MYTIFIYIVMYTGLYFYFIENIWKKINILKKKKIE